MDHNHSPGDAPMRPNTGDAQHRSHSGMNMSHDTGHNMHMGHMRGEMKRRFFISLVFSVPIVLLSPMMGIDLPFRVSFNGSEWVVLVLATVLYFYGGAPFLGGARSEIADGKPAMMTLISTGISVAYFYSLYAFVANNFLTGREHVMDFFWELATLIVIMLLGHWIEMSAVAGAGDALGRVASLLPSEANVKSEDGTISSIPLAELEVGQLVVVKAGGRVPADGVVESGSTSVNESLVTGESREVAKEAGAKVIGGTVNGAGVIEVRVTGTGESGYLARVARMIEGAQGEKSRVELLSDRVAGWLFYIALFAGVATFAAWITYSKELDTALMRMVTVLVIACPHALGLAVPLVAARSISLGARNGLLIRRREALEAARRVDVVMMDKTGTLTEGDFQVTHVVSLTNACTEEDILSLAGSLEQSSSHPLSGGIMGAVEREGLRPERARDVRNIAGMGLEGVVGGHEVKVVSARYLEANAIPYDRGEPARLASEGDSISFVVMDGKAIGILALGDRIKPSAKEAVEDLKSRGVSPVILTGDSEESARPVAEKLGIDGWHASLLPEDKERMVREYLERGCSVMMVGDGVNDAPSLALADVGVAIGAGADVAVDSADVVLVRSEPLDILHLLSLANNTARKMKENLWWGAGYNIVAIPLAAGVLAPWGLVLSPAAGAVLMSLSTVIVAFNAMTLRIE